jgi:hypothetical protein
MESQIPVMLMAFIRPDLIAKCLHQLSKFKPPILYVMADGPRNEKEEILCEKSRELALNPNWDCEVIPIFNDENQGIVRSFIKGMNRMFSDHEYGIYLEDDILLSKSFYEFSQELLVKYRMEPRIGHINATNAAPDYQNSSGFSYHYGNYVTEWGFATWKRMWDLYDVNMETWKTVDQEKILANACCNRRAKRGLRKMFDLHCNNPDPWAWGYQWHFNCVHNNALSITPTVNMSLNLGFERSDSTNTFGKNPIASPLGENKSPLKHPDKIERDWDFDQAIEKIVCPSDYAFLTGKIRNKIKSLFMTQNK